MFSDYLIEIERGDNTRDYTNIFAKTKEQAQEIALREIEGDFIIIAIYERVI